MYCPACGVELASPAPQGAPFPMFFCTTHGIVYDLTRDRWYGLKDLGPNLRCPGCSQEMEAEPRGAPTMHFCYQCGVTFDVAKSAWYGIVMHLNSQR